MRYSHIQYHGFDTSGDFMIKRYTVCVRFYIFNDYTRMGVHVKINWDSLLNT